MARERFKKVSYLGCLVLAGAVVWWWQFYSKIATFVGGPSTKPPFECLYQTSGACGMVKDVASLVGATPYEPAVFWVGAALVIFGVLGAMLAS